MSYRAAAEPLPPWTELRRDPDDAPISGEPSPEVQARVDAWLASEDPEFLAALDELDRSDDRAHRRR